MATVAVDWDATSDDDPTGKMGEDLPALVEVPEEVILRAEGENDPVIVADWLSDEYGFCVFDWAIVPDEFRCEQGCGRANYEYCQQPDCPHKDKKKEEQ